MTPMPVATRRTGRRRAVRAVVALVVTLALLPAWAVSATADVPSPADRPQWVLPEGGDMLAAFDRSDYNEQDGVPQQVASPDSPSRRALQFTLDGGDQRTELEPSIPNQREGEVQYYKYIARLAPDFPTDVDTWQVLLQWHHEGESGSPPIALEVRGGRLMIAAEGEDLQDLGPVAGGDQIDLTLRIAFAREPERGTVDVWRGGDHVMRSYRPEGGTMLDRGNYLKVGLYRDESIDETGRLWLDDLRVGPSMESVRSPVSASGAEPVEDAETGAPAASSASSDGLMWVAGGLLVVVGLAVVTALRRQARR